MAGTSGNDTMLYLHVPKTGGHWAIEAMKAAGVELTPEGGDRHADLSDVDPAGRFTFCFVRDPLSWYASWWKHCRKIDPTWLERTEDFREAPHVYYVGLPFEDYVAAVLSEQPHVTNLYRRFSPPDDPIDFVGRYESLADDLGRALEMAGQDFDDDALRSIPPRNVSGSRAKVSPALKRLVRHAEREVYERFYGALTVH